jgi:hypothetical protein
MIITTTGGVKILTLITIYLKAVPEFEEWYPFGVSMKPEEERRLIRLMLLPLVFSIGGGVLAMVIGAAVAILRVIWHSLL